MLFGLRLLLVVMLTLNCFIQLVWWWANEVILCFCWPAMTERIQLVISLLSQVPSFLHLTTKHTRGLACETTVTLRRTVLQEKPFLIPTPSLAQPTFAPSGDSCTDATDSRVDFDPSYKHFSACIGSAVKWQGGVNGFPSCPCDEVPYGQFLPGRST